MSKEEACLSCGGTGIDALGNPCSCGCSKNEVILPTSLKIPMQYQSVKYDKAFIRSELQGTLGVFMERLLENAVSNLYTFHTNYIICAPANSGKTVWAYNLYGRLYAKGIAMPDLMDLMQVRKILLNYYNEDKEQEKLINSAKLMVVKLPQDLPDKFPETISMIIERRVRNNCSTFFLYNGSRKDLLAQDRFGKMKYLEGDGAYNTVCIESFWEKE